MKKILLAVTVLGAFTFASCKKERTCSCTGTYTYTDTEYEEGVVVDTDVDTESDSYVATLGKVSKKDAEAKCVADDYTTSADGTVDFGDGKEGYVTETDYKETCKLD